MAFERNVARVSWKLLQFFFFQNKFQRLEHVLFWQVSFTSYFRKWLSKENFLACHYLKKCLHAPFRWHPPQSESTTTPAVHRIYSVKSIVFLDHIHAESLKRASVCNLLSSDFKIYGLRIQKKVCINLWGSVSTPFPGQTHDAQDKQFLQHFAWWRWNQNVKSLCVFLLSYRRFIMHNSGHTQGDKWIYAPPQLPRIYHKGTAHHVWQPDS